MSFMKREVTDKMNWLCIDGSNGIICVPLNVLNISKTEVEDLNDNSDFSKFSEYYGYGEIFSVEVVNGHGCRFSAPGYTDCTEWTVFPTKDECELFLTYMEEM